MANLTSTLVFSAQAEVFLDVAKIYEDGKRFLRASGGVSTNGSRLEFLHTFSPRKRRCFCVMLRKFFRKRVFSAQAEVFLSKRFPPISRFGFLRASGGVSLFTHIAFIKFAFSPRKRRCFSWISVYLDLQEVFSAQAEVFLVFVFMFRNLLSFLRASGGVSMKKIIALPVLAFSPRKRRCFWQVFFLVKLI